MPPASSLSFFEADTSFEPVGVRIVPSLYKAEITVELAQGILKFQTRTIVVAYAVNKKNKLHGQQTIAEACAKHLQEHIEGRNEFPQRAQSEGQYGLEMKRLRIIKLYPASRHSPITHHFDGASLLAKGPPEP
jgi:hypothetical protein